jgi:Na+-transporting methylmalonyl-CoA/oxaloacetate decarboxylase beta subunit
MLTVRMEQMVKMVKMETIMYGILVSIWISLAVVVAAALAEMVGTEELF